MDVQRGVEEVVEKRRQGHLRLARRGQLSALLEGDLNMPKVELWHWQPIALLKTLIEREGLYDRGKELNWEEDARLRYRHGDGGPAGKRSANPWTHTVVLQLFNTLEIQFPDQENLRTIYSSILSSHVETLNPRVQAAADELTGVTLALYDHILEKLPPTPSRFTTSSNLRIPAQRIYEEFATWRHSAS